MTTKKNQNYLIKNAGEFIMLFPQGNAFLYPGAECLVTETVSPEQIKRWEETGAIVKEISQEEADKLSSGVLGIK